MCDPVSTLKSVIDLAVEVYKSIEDADEAQELLRKEMQFVNSILKNSEVDDDRHLLAHDEFDQLNLTIHECVLFVHDTSNKTKAALEASLKNFYSQAKTLAARRLSMNANTLSTPPSSPSTISETGKVTPQKAEGSPDVLDSDAGNSMLRKKDPGMWNPKKRLARARVLQGQIHEHIRKINLALNMDALAFAKASKAREVKMNDLLKESLEREKEILEVLKEIKQDRDRRMKEKEKERFCSSFNFSMFSLPSVNLLGWGTDDTKTVTGTTRKAPSQKSTSPKKAGPISKPPQPVTKSPSAPKR